MLEIQQTSRRRRQLTLTEDSGARPLRLRPPELRSSYARPGSPTVAPAKVYSYLQLEQHAQVRAGRLSIQSPAALGILRLLTSWKRPLRELTAAQSQADEPKTQHLWHPTVV